MGLFSIFIVFLLFYLGKIVYSSEFFTIETIKSNLELDADLRKNIVGKSIFALDTKELCLQILKNHPEYRGVYILKEFPSSLRIEIKTRKPFAQFKGDRFYPIDRHGTVVSDGLTTPFINLIPIEFSGHSHYIKKGSKIKDIRLELAFNILEQLIKKKFLKRFNIKLINVTSPEAAYFVIDNTNIIIGRENPEQKLNVLEDLLREKLKYDISLVKYIDLRYKKAYLGLKR
jgi:cell division septal protein FtsQ